MPSRISIHNIVLLLWGVLAFCWALSLVWVVLDVHRRCRSVWAQLVAALAALVLPGFGLLVYLFLRPRSTLEQRYAHSLWVELAERSREGERCPTCATEVERDFVACPVCATSLRPRCAHCEAALEPAWLLCPYCESPPSGRETAPPRRGAADDEVPVAAAQAAPVAAPAGRASGKRRSSQKRSVKPVPKRAA
ncbi:MAG: double zinc ribbon domain-containing protein [Gaiellaceae bacterium]